MSKRRNRKSTPNIPQDILERARQQIAEQEAASTESGAPDEAVATAPETPVSKPAPRQAAEARGAERAQSQKARPRRREGMQPLRLGEKKFDPNDTERVRQILENPTKVVTEEELRREYSYVVNDLKSMAVLAAGLIVALVIIAQLL